MTSDNNYTLESWEAKTWKELKSHNWNVKKVCIADSGIPIWAIYKREISLCFKL